MEASAHHVSPNRREYQLVQYLPLPCGGMIPPVLPPCLEQLPWEKKEKQEKDREERRKKQTEQDKAKKKSLLGTIGSTITNVATATADAISTFSDDLFFETQTSGAEGRFRKFFPGFPREKLLGEYETRLVSCPESMMHGRSYITSSFFSFQAESHGKYILVMIPLKAIQSIQKAVVTKPPPGIPAHYPPQFHIVVGGELNAPSDPSSPLRLPKVDSLVLYTKDGMQHMFFDFKYFNEMYCVLDHAWRNPNPKYAEGTGPLRYTTDEFINEALKRQMQAYQQISEFKQSSSAQFSQQQFEKQQQQFGESSNDFFDPDFFAQQQSLQQCDPPLYPVLE